MSRIFVDYTNLFRTYDQRHHRTFGAIDALVVTCSAMAGRLPDSERDAAALELQRSLDKLKLKENISEDYLEGYQYVVSQVIDSQQRPSGPPEAPET